MTIILPPAYNNESAHQKVKWLMEQKKNLSIRVDNTPCVWISNSDITRLKYILNTASWNWIINYLKTGNPDDFRVFPSQKESLPNFQTTALKALVKEKHKIYRIPFLRETQPCINLIAVFKFGKIYFRIRLTDPIVEYLNSNNI